MAIIETVYLGRDNTIDVLLTADDAAVDLSAVTRMVVTEINDEFEIDSDDSPAAFNWDTGTTGKVVLALGAEDITAGTYVCSLIVYDPTNDDGINWGRIVLKFE